MSNYSRNDMIVFAKFAKSYQSPQKVEDAYDAFLDGKRLINKKRKVILPKVDKCKVRKLTIY